MDEELYRYALRSSRLSDRPPRPNTPPGHVSWRDYDLKLSRFSGDSEGSAVVDLTLPQLPRSRQCALSSMALKAAICTSSKENGRLQRLPVFRHNFLIIIIRQLQLAD